MAAPHQIVLSRQGYPIGQPEPDRAYWAVRLKNPECWLCEMDMVDARIDKIVTQPNALTGLRDGIGMDMAKRTLDWTLDIASTGDWKRITELWLICPPSPASPTGNTARLPITTPGTAFQFKVGFVDSAIVATVRRRAAQLIGRVTDVETGACECWVYDYDAQGLLVHEIDGSIPAEGIDSPLLTKAYGPWHTNVYAMGTWRPNIPGQPSIAPIGRLAFEVLGLHL